jgi:exodeoxyribonuclease VII large subunit
MERRRERFEQLAQRLSSARFAYANARRAQIERARERTLALFARASLAAKALLQNRAARVERSERLLTAVSYRGVLARGFALVRAADGKPLRSAAAVTAGLQLTIEFADGRVHATADGAPAVGPAAAPAKPPRRGGGEGQGSLFGS